MISLVILFPAADSLDHLVVLTNLLVLIFLPRLGLVEGSRNAGVPAVIDLLVEVGRRGDAGLVGLIEVEQFFHHDGLLPVLLEGVLHRGRRTVMIFSFSDLRRVRSIWLMRLAYFL